MKRKLLLLMFVLGFSSYFYGQTYLSEGFEGGALPTGWTYEYASGSLDWAFQDGGHSGHPGSAHTGSYNAIFYEAGYANDATKLVTPEINLSTATNPKLVFWHAQQDWSSDQDTLAVYYRTSSTDSWHYLDGWTNSISSWTEETIYLPNPSSTYQIAFHGYQHYGYGVVIDDVKVEEVTGCADPTTQTVSNITTTGADLSWTDPVGSHWDLYIVSSGSPAPTSSTTPTVNDYASTTYTWTGGSANTTYDWYVRSDCGQDNSNTSAWVGPNTFTTSCNALSTFPYSEDFSSWEPSCWTIDKSVTGSTFEWTQYSSGGVDCAKANFWGQQSGNTDIMYTPTFDVSGLTTPSFNFKWSHKYNSSYSGDSLSVEVSDNGGSTWHQVWTKGGSNLNSNDGAGNTSPGSFVQTADIDLSSYGNNIIIRFFATSGYGPDLFVDDVVVREMPSCPDPANQTVSKITTTGADLGWTDATGSHWDIYVVATGGAAPTQSTTPTANDVTTNSYTWTGGTAGTTYDWYVRSDCDQDNTGTSSWVGPSTFTTLNKVSSYPYSESFETDFGLWTQASDDDMDWTRKSGSTPSGNTGPSSASDGSYYIYTEASGNSNKEAIITLAFDFSSLTTPYLTFDYHMYGGAMGTLSFEASTDNGNNWTSLWSKSGDQGNQWNSDAISMSSYGGNSNVYIRIHGTTGNSYTSDMAIDNIVVEEAPTCPDPSGQTESNITVTTADLDWTENGSASSWEIMIDTAGFDTTAYTHTATSTKPYHATGLSANTSYDWYVRSSCGHGSYSGWIGPSTFTTKCSSTSVPYFEHFDDVSAPNFPSCLTVENANSDSYTWQTTSAVHLSSPNSAAIRFNSSLDMDDWFFTQGLSLTGGTTYEVSFVYKAQSSSYPESLAVDWGTDASSTAMSGTPIFDSTNIINTSWEIGHATFTPSSTGTYYVGFHGHSVKDMYYLFVDDIQVTEYTGLATWTGNADSDWENASNWSTTVPGASSDVSIPEGLTNYPTITTTGYASDFIINSSETGDGSVIGGSHIQATGDVVVKRYITKGKWHDIGIAVTGQTLNTYYLNHNPDVWVTKYNESDDSRTYLTDLTEAINPGYGNEIWVDANYSGTGVTFEMTGPLVSSDVSPTLSFTDASHGYNLIANPYTSAIDLDDITTLTNVDSQFWVWNPNASGGGTYYDWNSSAGAGALTNGIVPMGQGFFVHTNAASPSITIPTSAAVHSSQAYYKSNNGREQEIITLIATGDDQLNILFMEGATEQYEAYDTKKMFASTDVTPQIFSKAEDVMLSLNSLPALNNNDERVIPVGFISDTTEGIKEITADIALPEDVEVILEDTKLNIFHDLRADNIYRFAAYTDDEPMRFILHVGRNITGIGNNESTTSINVYGFNNNIYILSNGDMVNKTKQVEIYDVMGRRLMSKQFAPAKMDVITIGENNSYVVVRIISDGIVSTHKIFVK